MFILQSRIISIQKLLTISLTGILYLTVRQHVARRDSHLSSDVAHRDNHLSSDVAHRDNHLSSDMTAAAAFKQSDKGAQLETNHHTGKSAVVSGSSRRYLTIAPLDGSFGRLGNFCFRYASALGIAKANNMTLVLPNTDLVREMRRAFQITAPLVSEVKVDTSDFVKVIEKHWGVFDTRYFFLPKSANVTLHRVYSQSWKYFYPIQRLVKTELKPQPERSNDTHEFFRRLQAFEGKGRIVIGVHVRRGDFLIPANQRWGYAVAPTAYFNRAIDYFITKYTTSKLIFVIASDDRSWCEKSLNFSGAPHHFTSGLSALEDFNILTQCDHHIISVGSFGWWTAWLSKPGTVIYYKDFPTPGSKHSKNHNPPDYYPSKWIAMS